VRLAGPPSQRFRLLAARARADERNRLKVRMTDLEGRRFAGPYLLTSQALDRLISVEYPVGTPTPIPERPMAHPGLRLRCWVDRRGSGVRRHRTLSPS
jgi:hypothetical protein